MGPPDLLPLIFLEQLVGFGSSWFLESTKFSLVTHDGIQNQWPREICRQGILNPS